MKKNVFKKGFSMVELIIVIGLVVAIFAGAVLILNPAKRMGEANDTRRWQDIAGITNAIELYAIENHQLPTDLSTSTLSVGEKFVLCDTPGVLSCDGQSTSCLVISDPSFLGVLLPALPVDPQKSSASDTGYYVTRTSTDALAVGSCSSYDSTVTIEQLVKASLPAVVSECGDSFVDSDEVCDDGDVTNEGCGNASIDKAGIYCNSNCSATIVIATDELCDSNFSNSCFDVPSGMTYYRGGYVGDRSCGACHSSCGACVFDCIGEM